MAGMLLIGPKVLVLGEEHKNFKRVNRLQLSQLGSCVNGVTSVGKRPRDLSKNARRGDSEAKSDIARHTEPRGYGNFRTSPSRR